MSRRLPKYVNGFVDRHGRAHHYFRRPGRKSVRLPGLPGSPEFMAAYNAALTGGVVHDVETHVEIGASRTIDGTVNALVAAYLDCSSRGPIVDASAAAQGKLAQTGSKRPGKVVCRTPPGLTRAKDHGTG